MTMFLGQIFSIVPESLKELRHIIGSFAKFVIAVIDTIQTIFYAPSMTTSG